VEEILHVFETLILGGDEQTGGSLGEGQALEFSKRKI
jgi:hypothetical protein